MYSGRAAYSSGVKHQGKMPRMVISATLGKALAMVCQPSTTVFTKRSLFGQLLCRESDFTFAGYFISATLGKALAMVCQPSTTVFTKRSLFGQLLCRESDFTFAGYFAASHVPTAEPRDTPEMCA